MLCDDIEDWNAGWGGREDQKGGDIVYLTLLHIVVRQKPTQHCKAIILQLKINFKKVRKLSYAIRKLIKSSEASLLPVF